ncbi:hypothetical protein H0H81_010125 [Sphagnurus paluster]|uniref:Cation/H+ exchanger transmembrane domain-containing protein n=1 Tax=Sphagnurus paluster TaxID=117069 RepID=A0A9P7GQA1_9AGAR|nr:hypothetical protein H0H81_010125 [Sphagnurus paluster]
MLTIGICTLLGSDDLLAAFACGTAFAWDGFFNRQTEESVFSSVIDLLFNVAAFVYVGAWMPFSSFQNIETTLSVWRLIVIAILVLILRRLPIMVALYKWIPDIKNIREAVFSGHFGPIGIGAVFISTLASEVIEKSPKAHDPQVALLSKSIQPIVAFMVLCSITIHGLSIPSFSLGRRVHTVSRTWSRHAPPDWTTSARIVERGAADIVINRDSVMERGELRADAKASESRTLNSSSQSMSTPEKDQGSINTRMEKVDLEPTEGKSDTPPDGTETVMEWTEGNQRIIERRSFPGDDVSVCPSFENQALAEIEQVEVEVVDIENPTTATSGLAAQLRQSLHGLVHHLSDSQDNNSRSPADVHANPAAETSAGQAVPEAEDDGGWASEEDGSERGSQSSTVPKKKTKTRPRSQLLGAKRQVRQRNPPRRSSGTPPVINLNDDYSGAPSSSTTPPNEESDSRGRSNRTRFAPEPHRSQSGQDLRTLIRSSSIGDNMGAPRNQRLTHIRALHSSPPTREASPSRSAVRFLNDTSRTPEAQD